MYHLNSTLHMWNFISKSDTILVYLWLLTRRLSNNVHSLESFSLVEPKWDQADELFNANEMAKANS